MMEITCFIGRGTSWAAFAERFDSREILWFSRPLISADRQHALVYRVQTRGPQNGRTDLYLMQRPPDSEEWVVVKALPIAIT